MAQIIKVKKGDTLSRIAKDNHTTVSELVKINHIKNPNLIYVDQMIELPENDEEMDLTSYVEQVEDTTNTSGNVEMFTGRENVDNYSSNNQDVVNTIEDVSDSNTVNNEEVVSEVETNNQLESNNIENVDYIDDSNIEEEIEEVEDDDTDEEFETIEEIDEDAEEEFFDDEEFEDDEIEDYDMEDISDIESNYDVNDRLMDVSERLPNSSDFYSSGRCGVLARETLETLGVVRPGYKANGVDYARNLANHPEAAMDGYTINGYNPNGNQSQVFDDIINENNGELSNLVISFNSAGHYRKSGQYGHVITITDIKDGKVYLMDTYDTRGGKWTRGTTPIEMGIDEFKTTYIGGGNSINYITHIKKQ